MIQRTGEDDYVFTKDLMEDARQQYVLDQRHEIKVPLTLIQGKYDTAVPWETALNIEKAFVGPNTNILFVEDGDHRLSRERDLGLIDSEILKVSESA